jgi:hypothetical protein
MKDYGFGYADGYREVWWNAVPAFPAANLRSPIAYQRGYEDGRSKARSDVIRGYSDHYGKR